MRSKRSVIGLGLLSTILLAADPADFVLVGSEWRPTEIDGMPVPGDPEVFIRFAGEGRLEGHGGCNAFSGSYVIDSDKIEIGPIAATRMVCGDEVTGRESRLFEALGNAETWVRDGIHLQLREADGETLIKLNQRDPD